MSQSLQGNKESSSSRFALTPAETEAQKLRAESKKLTARIEKLAVEDALRRIAILALRPRKDEDDKIVPGEIPLVKGRRVSRGVAQEILDVLQEAWVAYPDQVKNLTDQRDAITAQLAQTREQVEQEGGAPAAFVREAKKAAKRKTGGGGKHRSAHSEGDDFEMFPMRARFRSTGRIQSYSA